MAFKNIPIGEVLKEYGYISQSQLDEALKIQKSSQGKRLGQILQENSFVTEKQVLQALAQKLNLKLLDISDTKIDLDAVGLIPQQLARKYHLMAISSDGRTLQVMTNDPLNFYAQEDIRQLTGQQLEVCLVEKAQLERALERFYSEVSVRQAAKQAHTSTAPEIEELDVDETDGDAPIIKLLNSFIQRAYNTGTSDIHIEPFEHKTNVRMRIDGTIVDYVTLQKNLHAPLIARIKILANMDIAERRIPQDGHFRYMIGSEAVNIRVSVIPTVFGEKAVLRLLAGNVTIEHDGTFGMQPSDYERFKQILQCPNGIVYVTGPTGSGKSTTLYMVLEELAKRQVNISTIEDPVEKNIAGIAQMQVNNQAGLTFESGLRALLRQDPDIIMVGETRDNETASISVRAAITGHLVLSTLHTNNAVSSIVRLNDMGVEPYLIANSLVAVVAQRLMRKVCPYCAETVEAFDEDRKLIGKDIRSMKKASGCPRCNHTGYTGRIAIHEIFTVDHTVRAMIVNGASMDDIEQYAVTSQGMLTLKDAAASLVEQGVTTLEEFSKVTYYV